MALFRGDAHNFELSSRSFRRFFGSLHHPFRLSSIIPATSFVLTNCRPSFEFCVRRPPFFGPAVFATLRRQLLHRILGSSTPFALEQNMPAALFAPPGPCSAGTIAIFNRPKVPSLPWLPTSLAFVHDESPPLPSSALTRQQTSALFTSTSQVAWLTAATCIREASGFNCFTFPIPVQWRYSHSSTVTCFGGSIAPSAFHYPSNGFLATYRPQRRPFPPFSLSTGDIALNCRSLPCTATISITFKCLLSCWFRRILGFSPLPALEQHTRDIDRKESPTFALCGVETINSHIFCITQHPHS
ncbi:hypothetical protein SCP_0902390 [Sparassis crispa]|uniref:Uncharacterized protein n=1 Tax=Sparassis crispa TaxID=139825 RepID=A0A401GVY8_9APHY|nr:hypothetical protein SCP_0902390 [Sparassis crispa]GBE86360.1 hypothetical protein SCP_0902390 [Sparassis crispa]